MREKRRDKDPREKGQEAKRAPGQNERDRSAEEVNADQPSVRGQKPKRAPKPEDDHPGAEE
ncbi:hypothetical protein [Streptomyces sp. NPDC048248]|uniref:hypothetical protein n=1 Tax=Streptomyces sp. NPDC048248 TaxID=3365523 RepID=UPI0037128AC2